MDNFISFAKDEPCALLGFSCFDRLGLKKVDYLKSIFGSYKDAFIASASSLARANIKNQLISDFLAWRLSFDFSKLLKTMEQEKINFISLADNNYPRLLKEISSPPLVLYYQGDPDLFSDEGKNRLAIVGPRKPDAYANKIIETLVPELISQGIEIISGLAIGVDTIAHQETLKNQGKTIAVLGTGLDRDSFYPRENQALADKIIRSSGLLISEFPPMTPAKPQNFPRRNRIISGLCQATLIIQAKERSGSLITAASALDQNREVLAVPGNIFSELSQGTNNLIKAGAKTITSAKDILEIYKLSQKVGKNNKNIEKRVKVSLENESEKIVWQILDEASERGERLSGEEIVRISQLDTAVINSTLSILELRGIAKSDGMGYYIN